MDDSGLQKDGLVDLYIRLRDEVDSGERSLDPNHRTRAPIAVAVLEAAESVGADLYKTEHRARDMLGQIVPPATVAA
jgi:hypothetical protein